MEEKPGLKDALDLVDKYSQTSGQELTLEVVLGVIVMVIVAGGVSILVYWALFRRRRNIGDPSTVDLVGRVGLAEADLDPDGLVTIDGRSWPSRADKELTIAAGTRVRVVAWKPNYFVVAPAGNEPAETEQAN